MLLLTRVVAERDSREGQSDLVSDRCVLDPFPFGVLQPLLCGEAMGVKFYEHKGNKLSAILNPFTPRVSDGASNFYLSLDEIA